MRKLFKTKSLFGGAGALRKIFKPPLIVLGVIVLFVSLWGFQQKNIDLLDGKIRTYEAKITQASTVDERLKLEKDVLALEKDKTTIQNGAYTTLVQALGGLILSITAYVGWRNFKVAEDKQVTERFSKSIEHLGSEKIDIRLGGIYALEQIAIDSSKYHWTIVEILSAFIREKYPIDDVDPSSNVSEEKTLEEKPQDKTKVDNKVTVDIQAALTVLGRRRFGEDPQGKRIDLRKVKLPSVEIQEANLRGANLRGANLRGADLRGADLRGADLGGADLSGADLSGADLSEADLSGANLSAANLSAANLSAANLIRADLSAANLIRANLSAAELTVANLRGSNLFEANLFEANLVGANLVKVNLVRANLVKVNLFGVNLIGANLSESKYLTQTQIDSAITDKDTKLPDGLKAKL
jgi:uncharacterized protein YjbI with pentapeptide repeats